jgi:hypothetical protein
LADAEFQTPKSWIEGGGLFRVLRSKTPLTPENLAQMESNIQKTLRHVAYDPDLVASGVRNLLFGPGKNTTNPVPTTCSGGVCSAYNGIFPTQDPTRVLPADLRLNPNFKEVAQFNIGSGATKAKHVQNAISTSRKLLGFRGLTSAVPLAASVALGSGFLSSKGKPAPADNSTIRAITPSPVK